MSYLLEALQKSQKDRDQQLPNLQTPALQIEVPDEAPRSPWIYIAVAALIINSLVIVYLLLKPSTSVSLASNDVAPISTTVASQGVVNAQESPSVASAQAEPKLSAKNRVVVQEVNENPSLLSSASKTEAVNTVNVMAAEPTIAAIKSLDRSNEFDPSTVPDVYQLSFDVRSQIPALEMNSHIYAPNQADSFVMINNSSLTPGDTLTPELKLLAVTPDGAVLQFHEVKFLLPALKSFKP